MRRRRGSLAVGMAVAVLALLPGAASAGIVGVAPSDSDAPNQDFLTNDALWAVGVADVFSGVGQVCAVEDGTPASAHCSSDGFWGQPNAIGLVGTFQQPIVAPYLPPGTYRILGDNGGDGGTNVLSDTFSVSPCVPAPGVDCSKDIASSQLDQWKAAAGAALDGPAAFCFASTAYNVNGDKRGAATSFAAAGGSLRQYLLSIVQDGTKLEFRTPEASLDAAISLLQKVSCGAYLMYGDIIADPPDPDYKHVTEPAVDSPDLTGLVHADLAASDLAEVTAQGEAQRHGVERYAGAKAAADPGWAAFHAERLGMAGLRMQRAMRRSVAELRAFADEIDAAGTVQAASAQDVQNVRDITARIRVSGFNADELASLHGLGLNEAQIAEVRSQLAAQPLPAGTPGTSPADGLRAEADALEHTACGTASSVCGFDQFSRAAAAAGANAKQPPSVSIPDAELPEGDRGVNHTVLKVQLSHPTDEPVYGHLALQNAAAHPGVEEHPETWFIPAGRTAALVRVLVPGDTTPEPDETLSFDVVVENGALTPGPVTVTVHDDDGAPKPRPGARGLLAFTGPGEPSTYVAEPDGTNLFRVFDDTDLHRLVATDWSKDGDLLLMHRVPRTLDDGTGPGAPYFSLRVGVDGRTTGGAPTQLTPAGEWHVGARFSPDRRRLVTALLTSPWWKLEVHRLTAAGGPDGPPHVLGDDPVFAGWEVEFSADWSPDGTRILFDGCEAHFARCGVYTVPVDADGAATGPPVPVVTHDADGFNSSGGYAGESFGAPSWSPDGRFISYIHGKDLFALQAQGLLERVPVNAQGAPTGPPVVLSSAKPAGGFYESSPDWAPDSRGITFYATVHPLTGESDPVDLVLPLDANGLPAGQPTALSATLLTPHGWGVDPAVWGPPSPAPPVVEPPAGPPAGLPPAAGVEGVAKPAPAPVSAPLPGPPSAANLPSNRRCISRRSFKIRLARPAGDPLAKAEVRVNGRKVQVVKKSRLTAPVDLRGLPKGKVKVTITATLADGRTVKGSRTYTTCAPKKR